MSDSSSGVRSPLRLNMPRRRAVRLLVLVGAFVAVGIVIVPQSPWVGWSAIAFFGLGVVLFAVQLARPTYLVLDESGFQLQAPFQRSAMQRAWEECSRFTAQHIGGTIMVIYSSARDDHVPVRKATQVIAGGDEGVQAGFGGLSADQLAELMNRYRDAKLASTAPES